MRIQRGNSHIALLHGNYQPRTLDLARDVMQLPCTSSLMDGTIWQGFTASCRIPNHTCSHDVTLRIAKSKPRNLRGSPREHMCCARP